MVHGRGLELDAGGGASQIIVERAWIWFVRTGGSEDGGRSMKREGVDEDQI